MAEQVKNCYLGVKGKKLGPVSEQDVQRLYNEKKITGDVLFARAGATEWIPLSKSGIIAVDPVDNLPPLPMENKTTETKPNETITAKMQSAKTESTVKKSKLGYIAAGLGVAVVASVVFVVVMFSDMGTTPNVPVDATMQDNTTESSPPITTAPPVSDRSEVVQEVTDFNLADIDWITVGIPGFHGFEINIPSTWTHYYVPWDDDYGPGYFGIDGGDIQMTIEVPTLAPDTLFASFPITEPFTFHDGHIGFFLEDEWSVNWLHSESYNLLSLRIDGNRAIFEDNEELITAIARTLTAAEEQSEDGLEELTLAEITNMAEDYNRAGNLTQAVYRFREAAERGYAPAQFRLGGMYFDGRGVAQNDTQAVYWFRQAAEQGHATSQANLGLLYLGFQYSGRDVPAQDFAQALHWNRLAAEQGNATAQNTLGIMYANGLGMTQDLIMALEWYELSADQGYEVAINNRDDLFEFIMSQISERFDDVSTRPVRPSYWLEGLTVQRMGGGRSSFISLANQGQRMLNDARYGTWEQRLRLAQGDYSAARALLRNTGGLEDTPAYRYVADMLVWIESELQQ